MLSKQLYNTTLYHSKQSKAQFLSGIFFQDFKLSFIRNFNAEFEKKKKPNMMQYWGPKPRFGPS